VEVNVMANSRAIYNIAFRCIDYCKNIESGGGEYDEYFSPNNIRRLIISPDVVAAEFYIGVPSVGKGTMARIPAAQLMYLSNTPDYVPMVSVINTDRVCSSIEEVVFLMVSNDMSCQLSPSEYQLSALAGKNTPMERALELVKKRFVRLRAFTRLNCSWNQFRQIKRDKSKLVAELAEFKNVCQYTPIHVEPDWYKKWGSPAAAKFYPMMDGVNGHLWQYFQEDIEKRNKLLKDAEVEEFTKKKTSRLTFDFNRKYDAFVKIARLQVRFAKALAKTTPIEGMQYMFEPVELQKFYDCDADMLKAHVIPAPSGMSVTDIIKENTERLDKNMKNVTNYFTDGYFKMLNEYANKYPYCTKFMLKNAEATVIPCSDLSIMARLAQDFGYTCNGKNMWWSAVNICWQTFMFFAQRDSNLLHDYVTPGYWEEVRKR